MALGLSRMIMNPWVGSTMIPLCKVVLISKYSFEALHIEA